MRFIIQAVFIVLSFCSTGIAFAQAGAENGEWKTYGGDLGHTRYSPLAQINADNFANLELAWRFKTDNMGPRPEYRFQSTPLMIGGTLYTTGGTRRAITALDAVTGEQLWVYGLNEGERGDNAPRRLSGRGLSYWSDGTEERIVYVTPGYRLLSLDAKTGRPITSFGDEGIVDLRDTLDQGFDFDPGQIGLHSPPTIAKNVVIVGAAHTPFAPADKKSSVTGYIRGFDVITGRLLWTFHTVPRAGELGFESWLENSAEVAGGNAGVWARISVDEELELVYLPVESAYSDMYGGLRPGSNLFSETIVAVDLYTGERKWHYQTVHHGLWDMDIPAAPILVDAIKDGQVVKALAQPTKQGFLFVLNRETGEPVWPIEEQDVPVGNVPGEWYAPTQPIPTLSYGHQGVSVDDLIDFTPELRAEAEAAIGDFLLGPIYTPPVHQTPDGPISTLAMLGGSNWPGGSYDPESNIVYVTSGASMSGITVCAYPEGSVMPFGVCTGPDAGIFGGPALNVQGLPLLKPPYGTLAAIDLSQGKVIWEVPNGETPDQIKNHPALKDLDIGRTGRSGTPPGSLVTKTLLIVGEPGFGPTPDGRRGSMLRAYDKATGDELAAIQLPAPQSGSPMTYMLDGVQYLVIAISGAGYSGELIALKAPVSGIAGITNISANDGRLVTALPSKSVWEGVYTEQQQTRGREIYTAQCSVCHGAGMEGLEMAPALTGFNFNANWSGQTIADLMQQISLMPPTKPGGLPYDERTDVLAYLLSVGGFPAGNTELGNLSSLDDILYRATQPLN